MPLSQKALESQLCLFDADKRRKALETLVELAAHRRNMRFPEAREVVNLHCHTFFSYNGYGYSPSYFAWKARCQGLGVAGIVDFDVLDGVDEFLQACSIVGLRGCAGMETRVYVGARDSQAINSPGEPGIAYHMGAGFTTGAVNDPELLGKFKGVAQRRNEEIVARVNAALPKVAIDLEQDVLSLTPKGNPTERHVCTAYDAKSREVFPGGDERAAYWADKLGMDAAAVKAILNDGPVFQGLIRSKMMKKGGPGYVQPQGPDFLTLEAFNAFILANGAIPVYCWLDGSTDCEKALEETLDLMMAEGAAAVNIIPDRNWNVKDAEVQRQKVAELERFINAVAARDLPIMVGTEMNAYGQRFEDDFQAGAVKDFVPLFLEGAYIVYAHTMLQQHAGLGYLSDWAKARFDTVKAKNAFYANLGKVLAPEQATALTSASADSTPDQVLALAQEA